MDDLELDIFMFIKGKQKQSNNKSGTKITDIMNDFGLGYRNVREIVIKLYREGKITSREGMNTNLIFLKDDIHR
jgi:predicted transcriptional regulator